MAQHTLDIAAFRAMFPQFADTTIYTDATITLWWSLATCAMESVDNCYLYGDCMQECLNLMMAHIGTILTRAATGGTTGVKTQATIDKVSVTYATPPFKDGWEFWLSGTPYGQMLWALLLSKAPGGFYFGGFPEGDAFRRVYGVFPGR